MKVGMMGEKGEGKEGGRRERWWVKDARCLTFKEIILASIDSNNQSISQSKQQKSEEWLNFLCFKFLFLGFGGTRRDGRTSYS